MSEAEFKAEIDALYKLPLSEFVTARNDLVKRVRPVDKAAAARIKALSKPSVSAWAVNQVYWTQREAFRELSEAGEAVKNAQSDLVNGTGDATAVALATRKKREAQFALVRWAERLLFNGGHAAILATMRRIETTLDVIAGHGSERCDPPPGRLSQDLEPVGFGVFAALAASLPIRPPKTSLAEAESNRPMPAVALAEVPREAVETTDAKPAAATPDPETIRRRERLAELEDLLMRRQAKKQDVEDGVRQASSDIDLSDRDLRAAQEKKQALEAELGQIHQTIIEQTKARDGLHRELETRQAKLAEIEEQLREHRAEVEQLERDLAQ